MKVTKSLIQKPRLIFLSPHYDDVPLVWGGYLNELAKLPARGGKALHIINIFSRTVYQARDAVGNRDLSLKRIQFATGIRLLEDLNCLDDLLGFGGYTYQLLAERECTVRAKAWKEGEEFEFPQGAQDSFNKEDWDIFARVKHFCRRLLLAEDCAVFTTLAVKEHIDHVIVRDAVIESAKALGRNCRAAIYFGEDQPYTGLAQADDTSKAQMLIDRLKLEPIDYRIDLRRKTRLVMKHYSSQVEESYRQGLLLRARQLAGRNEAKSEMERIYKWNR